MRNETRLIAFAAMRNRMDELFEKVEDAQRALDILAERDGIDLSPEAIAKKTEGLWLQSDTSAALKHLKRVRKEAVEYHDGTYVKERDELTALGILKRRPGKRN